MKNMKRILTVKFVKEVDTDPDFSYLGEYSAVRKDEYSIDRAHSKDCNYVNPPIEALEKINRVMEYLFSQRRLLTNLSEDIILFQALDCALDIVEGSKETLEECNCGERGDMRRGEWRYFNGVTENYAGCTPEEIRQYVRQDYERMEDYNNQGWCYMLTHAEAEIQVPYMTEGHGGRTYYMTQKITSGYCGGTESDSGDEVFEELKEDSLAELKGQLRALGFGTRAISQTFKTVKDVDR